MAIVRINEFRAQKGKGDALRELIRSFVPAIEASRGCLSCRLLQAQNEAEHIVVVEEWDDVGSHEASLKHIPPDALQKAMTLMAGPPSGQYFKS